MPFLTREQILGAKDLLVEVVDVPEWGEGAQVRVRGLTARERDDYEAGMLTFRGKKDPDVNMRDARARMIVMAVCDENGNRMFTDQDLNALAKRSAIPMDRLYTVAVRLSGITKEEIEEITKNSGGGQSEGSSSGLPLTADSGTLIVLPQ